MRYMSGPSKTSVPSTEKHGAPALHAARLRLAVVHGSSHVAEYHSALALVCCSCDLAVKVWVQLGTVQHAKEGKPRTAQELSRVPACQPRCCVMPQYHAAVHICTGKGCRRVSAEALDGHTCNKPVQGHIDAALYVSGVKLWRRPDINDRHAVLLRKQQFLQKRLGRSAELPEQGV